MSPINWILLAAVALPLGVPAQDQVNRDSRILEDFSRRVADYVKLHKTARGQIHGLKPTESPEAIEHYEQGLAQRIREGRGGAVQGSIFTHEISAELRRLIAITMQGPEAARIRKSLLAAAPVQIKTLSVNGTYPAGFPLQSMPPSILLNLPPLPPEVEYRLVGHDLVLRDVEANLIVDFITHAIH